MMRFLKWALILGTGVAACVVVILFLFLNTIVKAGIETMGPKMVQAPVTVESVDLSPFTGSGSLKGIVVGNPEGYKTESAFKLAEVRVNVAISSLLSRKIVIQEIFVDAPEITYELGLGESNIGRIQKNIAEFTGPAAEGEAPAAAEGDGKKVQIDEFLVKDGKIRVSAKVLGGAAAPVPLPDIHLQGIGKDEGGTSPGEAAKKIFSAITDGIFGAVKGVGGAVTDGVSGLIDGVGGLFKKEE